MLEVVDRERERGLGWTFAMLCLLCLLRLLFLLSLCSSSGTGNHRYRYCVKQLGYLASDIGYAVQENKSNHSAKGMPLFACNNEARKRCSHLERPRRTDTN